jgi:hypothetical protein
VATWAKLDATFLADPPLSVALIMDGLPSSDGRAPGLESRVDGSIRVHGILKYFDELDWPDVLALFAARAQNTQLAKLSFEIQNGPSFRYLWQEGTLTRLPSLTDEDLLASTPAWD